MTPSSRHISIRGLSHHLLTWLPSPSSIPSGLTILLVHGFADAAGSWDLVAPHLAAQGHQVIAPDLRGFGKTQWVGAGGYYHFPDYVSDLDALVPQLEPKQLALVGHSMGGVVTTLFAAARPQSVHCLALLEGVGPPDTDPEHLPDRYPAWLDQMRRFEAHRATDNSVGSLEDMMRRLAARHPHVNRTVLQTRIAHLAHELPEGGYTWRMDPLHRTHAPMPFSASAFRAFARRVLCPVLFVSGGSRGFHPADEHDRVAAFPRAEQLELPGAGHMMHWTQPSEVAAALCRFFCQAPPNRG